MFLIITNFRFIPLPSFEGRCGQNRVRCGSMRSDADDAVISDTGSEDAINETMTDKKPTDGSCFVADQAERLSVLQR